MTLIEAARTLLADSLLPIPFWAEAVNTACYVQNRVLVTKPHNKTPYELLHGRLPSIGFMRHFGCPVTILNTLDPLGKFQGKFDEGFFLILCSGLAWLFDIDSLSQTMNYHPVIIENQTNSNAGFQNTEKAGEEGTQTYVLFPVLSDGFTNSQNNNKNALVDGKKHDIQKSVSPDIHSSSSGSGPAWLFDIDSLSQTINYHPVIIENQTNSNAGFQDTEKAGEEGTQTYVLFPVLSDGFTNSQNNNKDALVDGKKHDIQKSVSPDIHSSSSGAQTRKQGDKTENKDKGKSHVVTITGFRDLNAEFEECNNNSSNRVNAASSSISTAGQNSINSTNDFSADGPSNAAMPNLEDLSHDANDVGA
nr:putative ribonuclease H-like domain-containing protein [Tanacetum cinerariifolium]